MKALAHDDHRGLAEQQSTHFFRWSNNNLFNTSKQHAPTIHICSIIKTSHKGFTSWQPYRAIFFKLLQESPKLVQVGTHYSREKAAASTLNRLQMLKEWNLEENYKKKDAMRERRYIPRRSRADNALKLLQIHDEMLSFLSAAEWDWNS